MNNYLIHLVIPNTRSCHLLFKKINQAKLYMLLQLLFLRLCSPLTVALLLHYMLPQLLVPRLCLLLFVEINLPFNYCNMIAVEPHIIDSLKEMFTKNWPSPTPHAMERVSDFCKLYTLVKAQNLPNALGASSGPKRP